MANEKRLIDANRLKMRMIAFATAIKREYLSIEAIVDTINTEDTVDAVEVVHGRWEKDGTCSNCKGLNPTYRENKWSAQFPDFPGNFDHLNYCPNCGAKMDGDGNA